MRYAFTHSGSTAIMTNVDDRKDRWAFPDLSLITEYKSGHTYNYFKEYFEQTNDFETFTRTESLPERIQDVVIEEFDKIWKKTPKDQGWKYSTEVWDVADTIMDEEVIKIREVVSDKDMFSRFYNYVGRNRVRNRRILGKQWLEDFRKERIRIMESHPYYKNFLFLQYVAHFPLLVGRDTEIFEITQLAKKYFKKGFWINNSGSSKGFPQGTQV